MKKLIYFLLIMISVSAYAQRSPEILQTQACIDDNTEKPLTAKERAFIDEVYGDHAQKLFYSNKQRLSYVKQILRNRVVVNYYKNKDLSSLESLSQVDLIDTAKNLQRDYTYVEGNFNPLKYDFGFFSIEKNTKHYRFGNTQYLITILPSH